MSAKSIIKKTLYYVANLGNNTITLIDGENNTKINTITLPFSPFTMILYEDFIYIGGDGEKIGIMNTIDNTLKYMDIENNGNIHIDKYSRRIYASNISEIGVYDIDSGKKLGLLKGFSIVDSIKIDNNRLFTVDVFRKQLKVYDIKTMKIITKIKDIGIRPNNILISDDGKTVYISNEGGIDEYSGNISVIDIEKNIVSTIDFPKNSSITSLYMKNDKIYALNKGLSSIDIIDLNTKYIEKSISILDPKNFLIEGDRLIVLSKASVDKMQLSLISINDYSVIKNIAIEEKNSYPYSVIAISKVMPLKVENEISNVEEKMELIDKSVKKGNNIIEIYNEVLSFKKLLVEIPENYVGPFILDRIIFNSGYIVKGLKDISKEKDKVVRIKFTLRVPYKLKIKDGAGKVRTLKRFIEEEKEVLLESIYLSDDKNIKTYLNTGDEVINEVILIKDILTLSVDVNMRLKFMVPLESINPMKRVK
ncbi:YncE family protein [Clostridium sp.]|uniref:YncE family protein n=1 Tax=Clostridium sp. TaxID=1506 RepID=UPI00346456E6